MDELGCSRLAANSPVVPLSRLPGYLHGRLKAADMSDFLELGGLYYAPPNCIATVHTRGRLVLLSINVAIALLRTGRPVTDLL